MAMTEKGSKLEIVTNARKKNHFGCMKKIAEKSDTLIIVSPFLSDDMSSIAKELKIIKKITIYTTLQKYEDTARKIIALYKFSRYCKEEGIDLLIKIDENLHGKVYLFYNGCVPKGFLLTSGNFTENGLINNNEYGVCIVDDSKQKEMSEIIMSINTYDLTEEQLERIYGEAQRFLEEHPVIKQEKFKVHKLMNKKPSITQNRTLKYHLKPVGITEDPFIKPRVIKDSEWLGFAKEPKNLRKGDVLLLHGVGSGCIVGYYVIVSDEVIHKKNDDKDRWPWKMKAESYSSNFSAEWWDYELKTQQLVEEFLQLNPEKHITKAGGNTLGALKWGKDKVQITEEFAQYIIGKIPF